MDDHAVKSFFDAKITRTVYLVKVKYGYAIMQKWNM